MAVCPEAERHSPLWAEPGVLFQKPGWAKRFCLHVHPRPRPTQLSVIPAGRSPAPGGLPIWTASILRPEGWPSVHSNVEERTEVRPARPPHQAALPGCGPPCTRVPAAQPGHSGPHRPPLHHTSGLPAGRSLTPRPCLASGARTLVPSSSAPPVPLFQVVLQLESRGLEAVSCQCLSSSDLACALPPWLSRAGRLTVSSAEYSLPSDSRGGMQLPSWASDFLWAPQTAARWAPPVLASSVICHLRKGPFGCFQVLTLKKEASPSISVLVLWPHDFSLVL